MPHGGARHGAGRKPKPKGDKQSHVVSLNLTPSEYRKLSEAASAVSESLSGYVRRLLLRHLRIGRRES